MKNATVAQAEKYAERLKALVAKKPAGWGLFAMDRDLQLVPPSDMEELERRQIEDGVRADLSAMSSDGFLDGMIDAGGIDDSGGW